MIPLTLREFSDLEEIKISGQPKKLIPDPNTHEAFIPGDEDPSWKIQLRFSCSPYLSIGNKALESCFS
jgi:hypothetical protein